MIRAIIVDDEQYVRNELKERILNKYTEDIQVIDEASNVSEAIEKIKLHKPDLVFLDIDIIGGSGFDVVEQLDEVNFQIIFVTGYDDQAIKAIKIGALDYVLKPIDDDEFNEAINRVRVSFKSKESLSDAIKVSSSFYKDSQYEKIVLRTLEAHHVVYLKDILFCKSDGNYTTFHTVKEKIMISKPMKQIESLLDKALFLRSHQSYIVNLMHVTKYTNEGFLILKNGEEVPVASRRKEIVIKNLF